MEAIQERPIHCPNCGERVTILLDCSVAEQHYTEDCSVCCRPIVVVVSGFDGEAFVSVYSEDE